MSAHLLMQWKGLPENSAARLSGGKFPLHSCKLDIPCATGIIACVSVLLNMHCTSILGSVCHFCYIFLFFEFLIIDLKRVLIVSPMNSWAWSLDAISQTLSLLSFWHVIAVMWSSLLAMHRPMFFLQLMMHTDYCVLISSIPLCYSLVKFEFLDEFFG